MKKHKYGNTETYDLWNAWSQASGKDIGQVNVACVVFVSASVEDFIRLFFILYYWLYIPLYPQ